MCDSAWSSRAQSEKNSYDAVMAPPIGGVDKGGSRRDLSLADMAAISGSWVSYIFTSLANLRTPGMNADTECWKRSVFVYKNSIHSIRTVDGLFSGVLFSDECAWKAASHLLLHCWSRRPWWPPAESAWPLAAPAAASCPCHCRRSLVLHPSSQHFLVLKRPGSPH